MVERVNKFGIKNWKKTFLIILLTLVCIFIIYRSFGVLNDYNKLKSKYLTSASYEKKYNSLLPYKKLYQDTNMVNKALASTNTELSQNLAKYSYIIGNGNCYVNFKEEEAGKIKYLSNNYGISLLFPPSWKNQFMIQETSYNESNLSPITIKVLNRHSWYSGNGGVIFYIYIFNSKDNWNTVGKSIGDAIGITKLYEEGEKVIAYSLPSDVEYNEDEDLKNNYLDMSSYVESIVKTLKVIN